MSNRLRSLPLAVCIVLAAVTASPSRGETAHLVKDIQPGGLGFEPDGSMPSQLTTLGAKVAFVAKEPTSGAEVWVTDTANGRTESLGNLSSDSGPEIAATVGSRLFFISDAGASFFASLWASDGTAAGTIQLPGPASGARAIVNRRDAVAALPDRVVFLARRGDSTISLWSSDGTSAGTRELGSPATDGGWSVGGLAGVAGSRAFYTLQRPSPAGVQLWVTDGRSLGTRAATIALAAFGVELLATSSTHVFFTATTSRGEQLWASDGTSGGTRAVSSVLPVPAFDDGWVKPIGRFVYYLADDDAHGRELWRSDGTPRGTVRLTDFAAEGPFPVNFDDLGGIVEEVGGKVVFYASDEDSNASRLWTSTGSTASPRPLLEICDFGCTQEMQWLRRLGERLYFPRQAADGVELWSTDGTTAGTRLVTALCAGGCSLSVDGGRVSAGRLYFAVDDFDHGEELWTSDGTAAGTRAITALEESDAFSYLFFTTPEVAVAGGRIFFPAYGPPYGVELWSTDGAPESAVLAAVVDRAAGGSFPQHLVPLGGRVLFAACEGESQHLWASSGTAASTVKLTPPNAEGLCGDFRAFEDLVASGERAYFWADDAGDDSTLWSTDGTPAGLTALLTLPDFSRPASPLLPVPGGLAFAIRDLADESTMWRSDGTAAGTVEVMELPAFPQHFWADGSIVYLVGPGAAGQLWRVDLDTETIEPVTVGSSGDPLYSSGPGYQKLGGAVYFFADKSGTVAREVWKLEQGEEGARLAFTVPASAGDAVSGFSAAGGRLYFFTYRFFATGFELWRSDGTDSSTLRLATFATRGIGELLVTDLVAEHGRVFFVGNDLEHGRELWSTDGTPEGTALVRDLFAGPAGAFPAQLNALAGRLFFVGNDGVHGYELWETDGTAAGTRLVHDVAPGGLSGQPTEVTAFASGLFFGADDGLVGTEPWFLPLGAAGACQADATALCVGGRFRVEAAWRDFAGNTGIGHAAPLTADTGTFWFFSPSNVEVILKVLDGRGLNDHQWVFYGALSSVEYTLTVTDTQTGAVRRYFNPAGRLASVGDTEAFGPRGASALRRQSRTAAAASPPPLVAERRDAAAKSVCEASATRLCLAGGRFAVEVAWRDFAGNQGVGSGTALSSDTGDFWFFSADNIELVVKLLDGRPVNGKFWLFYGALSSVEYTLTVTDTETGTVRTYTNPSGRLASVADTRAF